jgi:hypothetical protein
MGCEFFVDALPLDVVTVRAVRVSFWALDLKLEFAWVLNIMLRRLSAHIRGIGTG